MACAKKNYLWQKEHWGLAEEECKTITMSSNILLPMKLPNDLFKHFKVQWKQAMDTFPSVSRDILLPYSTIVHFTTNNNHTSLYTLVTPDVKTPYYGSSWHWEEDM